MIWRVHTVRVSVVVADAWAAGSVGARRVSWAVPVPSDARAVGATRLYTCSNPTLAGLHWKGCHHDCRPENCKKNKLQIFICQLKNDLFELKMPVLGVFQRLIASKSNDHYAFYILNSLTEYLPR